LRRYPNPNKAEEAAQRSKNRKPAIQNPKSKIQNPAVCSPPHLRRSVIWLLGTLLIVVNAFFGTYAYVVVQALIWTQTSLLRGPLVMLALLVFANALLLRGARRHALSQPELLLLYAMLCLSTCAGGYGFVQILINVIAAPFHFATPSNGWQHTLWPHIPYWLAPREPGALRGFYYGHSTLYASAALSTWAVPVAVWTGFIFTLFWVMLCMTTLMRRRWVEEERLTFPLAYLPLAMTERDPDVTSQTPFWRNRLMWAGFLVAGLLESVNFVSYLYPSIPSLPIKPIGPNQLDVLLTQRPWNAAGMLRLAFYPFVIGIGYLLSLDISFSCWFLYLGVKVANIASALLGFSEGGGGGIANRAPYVREQSVGAFIGIALFSVWMARRSLAEAWREAKRPTGADRDELMSYRLAFFGGGAGALLLVGALYVAGIALPVAMGFVLVYLCFALTLARIVSEAGAGWAWAPQWSPTAFVTDAVGADRLSPANLTILYQYTTWMSDMRDNPMPQQMQSVKLGQSSGISPRAFLWPLLWAALFGTLCAFWAHLHIYYEFGASTAKVRPALAGTGPSQTAQTANLLKLPTSRDTAGLLAAGVGLILAIAFSRFRLTLAWWPFHPLGYALATTNSMDYMWCPFFVAWLAKYLTLRYGGIRAYRTALPFFLGLILGDYVVPALWSLWGMATHQQLYMVFPH
jgi:hypothetical protein